MWTKPPLQEGDKLLARTPVSLTNTLATTANGGQDYNNAHTQESHEKQWKDSCSSSGAQRICNTQAHQSKTQSCQLRFGPPTLVTVQASNYNSLLTTEWPLRNNLSHSVRLTENCFSSTLDYRAALVSAVTSPVYKFRTLIAYSNRRLS